MDQIEKVKNIDIFVHIMKYMILRMTGKYNVNIKCGHTVHIHIFTVFAVIVMP